MNRKEIFNELNKDYPIKEVSNNPIGLFETANNSTDEISSDENILILRKGEQKNGKSESSNFNGQGSREEQEVNLQNDNER